MLFRSAPPDTVRCGFLSFFGEADCWHFGAVGAPDTVRCPLLTVGSATRRARITRPTVGPTDCWLTGQSGAPPDSPVIYSRTPPMKSREQLVDRRQPGAPDTVRCTTGHCPVRISFLFWRSRPLKIQSRWRTGHCPVPPSDRWLCHASHADYAADRWPGRLLAHWTVRCTTGQSGDL